MSRWIRVVALPLVVLSVVAAACSKSTTTGAATGSGSGSCSSDLKVGLALDVGGLGDKGFNDLAYAGLNKAIDDGIICKENTKYVEANAQGSNLDQEVQSLIDGGYDLIIGTGFAFTDTGKINEIAPNYPDVKFGIIDGFATCGTVCGLPNDADKIPNVVDLTFKEQEGSYLVGVAAALEAQKLNCNNVGFLGGQTGDLIGKFQAGYEAGVASVDPKMTVQVEYIGDSTQAFDNPIQGEALSNKMYDKGACVIYHAAGNSGNGLFKAAAAQQKIAIGVDSDQYQVVSPDLQKWILTSMIKRVDTATYDTIKAAADGTFKGGIDQVFDLKSDGISYSTSNTALMTQDIIDKVEAAKQKILSGAIVPPSVPPSPSGG
ncbi:MAG TPA: BMP family protein [Actinomycetota bacterium]|nr:BMP family protein [Actinomycetota bacterium]